MRKGLIFACLFAMPCVSWAKGNKAAWENLNALQPGQKVQVIEKTNTKQSGTFSSVNDQGITLHEQSGDTTVQRENVARVSVPAHRARHVVLGLAIGASAGAAIGAATGGCSNSSTYGCLGASRGQITAATAAIGGVIGAIIGAVLPAHQTIYRASP